MGVYIIVHMTALDAVTRERLTRVSVSTLTTCLSRRGLRNVWLRGLRPVVPNGPRMVGPAFTLRMIPCREDIDQRPAYAAGTAVHLRAFETCPPGHVLVIDTQREHEACASGDLLIARLQQRGGAGIVADSGFRDNEDIARLNFPAYQAQPIPAPSFLRLQAIALDEPIACARVPIYPGDVMVGDAEGVVAIPAAIAKDVAEEAEFDTRYDEFALEQIRAGRGIPGLYPPNPASRAEYDAWQHGRRTRPHE